MTTTNKRASVKPQAKRARREQRPRQARKAVKEPRRHPPEDGEFTSPGRISARIESHMREDYSVQLTLEEAGEVYDDTDIVVLSPTVTAAVLEVLEVLSRGKGYVIEPTDYDLTSEQAADILHVEHDRMMDILDEGEIPFTEKDGSRRVRADALFAYRRLQRAKSGKHMQLLIECGEIQSQYEISEGNSDHNC